MNPDGPLYLTFGEVWHNNHHAHPQAARHGLAWYELDLNWHGIAALRTLGLAWDVKVQRFNPAEDKNVGVPRRLAARNKEVIPMAAFISAAPRIAINPLPVADSSR